MSVVRSKLSRDIRSWARDRQIIPNSNLKAQFLKLCEEQGELVLGIRKQNKELIKDSVGDMYVVLTIMLGLQNLNIEDLEHSQNDFYDDIRNRANAVYWVQNSVGDIAKYVLRSKENKMVEKVKDLLDDLNAVAIHFETNLDECITCSWNEIKDRRGFLREDGIFVKEADMKAEK
jgi:NTP pyrophosphatase (non-canonical NTP hydrolase)